MKKSLYCLFLAMLLCLGACAAQADSTLTLPEGLTRIEAEAFLGDTTISTVVVPEGFLSIGEKAFAGSGVQLVYLPESITSIAPNAFEGVSGMTAVVKAGGQAEALCQSLQIPCISEGSPTDFATYDLPDGTMAIAAYFGANTNVVVPSLLEGKRVSVIGENAFTSMQDITSLVVSEGIHTIGEMAFCDCTGLTTVTLPNSLVNLERDAFRACPALEEITFGNSLTTVGPYAFAECYSLQSVALPDSVTTIGDYAFWDCTAMTSASLGKNLVNLGKNVLFCCDSLIHADLGSKLTSLPEGALYRCPAVKTFTMPASVTIIEDGAIGHCDSLEEIIFSPNLTTIEMNGIYSCTALKEFILPDHLTQFNSRSFTYSNTSAMRIRAGTVTADTWGQNFTSPSAPDYQLTQTRDENKQPVITVVKYTGSSTSVTIPGTIDGQRVHIGPRLFSSNKILTSAVITEGAISIGESAFYAASALTHVSLPQSLEILEEDAFTHCSSLTELTLYPKLKTIHVFAFDYCKNLTLKVYSGTDAEYACIAQAWPHQVIDAAGTGNHNGLDYLLRADGTVCITGYTGTDTVIAIPAAIDGHTVTTIGHRCFRDQQTITAITLPDTVTTIGHYAFWNCTALQSVNIPAGVTTINPYTFNLCESLKSLAIPSGVTSIGEYAFCACKALKNITIPDGVTRIERGVFSYCEALTSLTLPDSVTYIGPYAFEKCGKLPAITLPDGMTDLGSSAFKDCVSLTSVVIPQGVTTINDHLFWCCSALQTVEIPAGVTSIGGWAFAECPSLLEMDLPPALETIGYAAFRNCKLIPVLELPDGVTSIGGSAFANCTGMNSIYIPPAAEDIDYSACDGCDASMLVCGAAGSEAESFAEAAGFDFSDAVSPEWLGARLPDEYFEVLRTYTIDGEVYHEIKLLKAYNGVAPQNGDLYLDHRYRVVRNPHTMTKLFTMSRYFDSPVSERLNVYAPTGMAWAQVATDFVNDEQMAKTLGSSAGIILKLYLGDLTAVVDFIGLADKDFFQSMGTITYIGATLNHLNKAVATAEDFAKKVEKNPTYDDVLLSLEHLRYSAVCYDAAKGLCMPIVDDILKTYDADWQLGFARLKNWIINFVGTMSSYMKALLTGIDQLASGDPDGISILTSFLEYLGKPFNVVAMTISAQSGIFEGVQQWTGIDPAGHDELITPYFTTVEAMRTSEIYNRQQQLGK